MKVPLVNGLNKTKGVEEAPEKILECLDEIYSNEMGREISLDHFNIDKILIDDDLVKTNDLIYRKAFDNFGNERILFLGGDHSVSYPLTRSFFDYTQNAGREPAIIIFDAHPDLMEPVDQKIPTHEEWLRSLVNDGFDPKNILIVGIRNADPSEIQFLNEVGIKRMTINEMMFNMEEKTDAIMEFGYNKDVYLSIDIDVVDPAFAPGTGYCEPGGFTSREFLYIIQRMNKMKNLKAVDLVEVNPTKDVHDVTSQLAAKIVSELN